VGKRPGLAWPVFLISVIGLGVSMLLNALVLDAFDAYGEAPIPGTRTLHLPPGT
jgi:hypothetical protein